MAITPKPPGSIDTPNTLTPDSVGTVAVPNVIPAESAGQVAIPNTLNAETAGQVAIPNVIPAEAAGSVDVPNTLNAETVGAITVPNSIPATTPAAFPRTLTPLVSLNFAQGCYAQCGNPVLFDDLFTYTRASTATFINRVAKCSGGYDYFVDTALSNVLRFEFDPETGESLGALIEGSITNLAVRSEEFDNASWGKSASTVDANSTGAPDNTTSADGIIATAANVAHFISQSITVTNNATVTLSVFAKSNSDNFILIFDSSASNGSYFDISTGAVGSSVGSIGGAEIKSMGDGWFRCSVTIDAVGTTVGSRLYVTDSDGSSSFLGDGSSVSAHLWGAQLEELPFATSYIKTEGSTVSRSADGLSIAATIGSEGTIFAKSDYIDGSLALPGNRAICQLDDGSNNNRILMFNGSSKGLATVGTSGSNVQWSIETGSTIGQVLSKSVVTYKTNDINMYFDGEFINNDTSAILPENVSSLGIGNLNGILQLFGHIADIKTYDLALTAQEVAAL